MNQSMVSTFESKNKPAEMHVDIANEPHIMVRMQNNQWVECILKETIYTSFSLFAQIAVKALHGRPFEGNNIAIVSSNRISFITTLRGK